MYVLRAAQNVDEEPIKAIDVQASPYALTLWQEPMHIRQIETFRAVMMCGSASRAADLLDITQPAVSRAIAELERSVGFALFDRSRGRLTPTLEAGLLFGEVEKTFVGLDKLRAEAARIRDFGVGVIRVASLSALGETLVSEALSRFQKKQPGIPVTLQIHSSAVVRELVVNGSFDIGLAADEVDLTGVAHDPFGRSHGMCALPHGDRLAEKEWIEPADLDGRRFVALAPEDRARQRLEAILAPLNVHPKLVAETPNASTVCALVLAGAGIGLVNPTAAVPFFDRGLVLRPFRPSVDFRTVLLFRADAKKSRPHRALIAALENARSRFHIRTEPQES